MKSLQAETAAELDALLTALLACTVRRQRPELQTGNPAPGRVQRAAHRFERHGQPRRVGKIVGHGMCAAAVSVLRR